VNGLDGIDISGKIRMMGEKCMAYRIECL